MCDSCGCGDPDIVPVEVHDTILAGNNRTAAHNRAHFAESGVHGDQSDGFVRAPAKRRCWNPRHGCLPGALGWARWRAISRPTTTPTA